MASGDEDDGPDGARGITHAASEAVAASLLALWHGGTEDAVYRFLAIDVAPRLKLHLRSAFSLQEADCEDCISAAYDRFSPAVRSRKILANPYGYFFKVGINAARELLRERRAESIDAAVEPDGVLAPEDADAPQSTETVSAGLEPPVACAVELVEDAVSEVEVEEFWAVEVVRLAVERLSPGLRRVAQALMYKDLSFEGASVVDFDYAARETAAELGMKAGAFRTAKHRAYAAIFDAVPALIIELNLVPPERAESAIFPEGRGKFLDSDDGL